MCVYDVDSFGKEDLFGLRVICCKVRENHVSCFDYNKRKVVGLDSIDISCSVVVRRIAMSDNYDFLNSFFEYFAHFFDMYLDSS